uniref:EGF-like domain-containing protein n=1 Tax=Parastrongyloides trichosuri TaxID=131310 RepID=A0A0N4ZKW5_PARTI
MFVPVPHKYDTATPIKGGFGCQEPGYTGQHCEYPICANSQSYHDDKKFISVLVDFHHLVSCDKMVPLYVDSTIESFTIECHTELFATPTINVYDSNATYIEPNLINVDTQSTIQVTYDYVKPGIYQIIPSTDTSNASCFIYVSAKAQGHVDIGFVPHTLNDTIPPERNDRPNGEIYIHTLNTIVAHTINVRSPGSISTVSIYQDYNIMSRPQMVSVRFGCEYDYYYNAFYCYKDDKYFMKIEGYDFYGNSFSRIKSFSCLINPNSTGQTTLSPLITTTKSPRNPYSCQNGGTLVTTKYNITYCYCSKYFTSFDCSSRLCFNGGTSLSDGTCICKDGFVGDSCEHIMCTSDSGYLPDQSPNMLIFVIRARKQMNIIIDKIKKTIKQIGHDFASYKSEWFNFFAVVTFNNYGERYDIKHFASHEALLSYLDEIEKNVDDNGDCYDNIFESIFNAIQVYMPPTRSPIYVFSDALPIDLKYHDNIIQLNSYYLSPIYFYLVQPGREEGCAIWDMHSPAWRKMKSITEIFSGSIFPIYNYEINHIQNILYLHLFHTYFMSSLMYGTDVDVCSYEKYNVSLAIDTKFDQLAIVGVGQDLDIRLFTPNGDEVIPQKYSLENFNFWVYIGLQHGQWSFSVYSIDDYTSCSIRAYSSLTPTIGYGEKDYKISWGFTNDITFDSPIRQPIHNTWSSFVAHIDNYMIPDMTKVSAELIIHSKAKEGRQMVFASNGIWRDGCIYEIYFSPFRCNKPDENLFFTLFVRDENDFYIQRAGSMYCTILHPTLQPPDSCLNGGFKLNNTCICPPLYDGRNCEKPKCFNGGSVVGNKCSCPPYVQGDYCEILVCRKKYNDPDLLKKNKRITFLLDTTSANSDMLKQLLTYSDEMLRDIISQDKQSLQEVIIIGFNTEPFPYIYTINDVDHLHLAKGGFSQAYNDSLTHSKTCQKINLWKALLMAVSLSKEHSEIFIFQSSIPLESDKEINEKKYKEIYNLFIHDDITLTAFIGTKGLSHYDCEAPPTSFLRLHALAIQTHQGDYYELSKSSFMNIPKLLPSFVHTGIGYKKSFKNCKGNCSVYFSVDSHTQNIQLKVKSNVGFYGTELLMPNRSVARNNFTLINDSKTGLTIIESRRFCPDGWEGMGPQYCMLYVSSPKPWQEAHDDCKAKKGFMVDILNDRKDAFVRRFMLDNNINDLWIGLSKMEIDQLNKWSWDRGELPSFPLQDVHYSNWDSNVNLNDSNKECAYKEIKWNVEDCNIHKKYLCQRHKYEDSYDPSLSEIEVLPPGKWWFNVKGQGPTSIEIRVQSGIQIHSGFLEDIHEDQVSHDANALIQDLRMATHVSTKKRNLFDTFLTSTQMFTLNGKMFYGVNYIPRFGCSFQYLSETFQCPDSTGDEKSFYALTYGVDELGNTIQRYTTHKCVKKILSCNKHGVSYNGKCYCNEYYTGNNCETTVCVNNGTYNEKTKKCDCRIGYDGDSCQYPICFNEKPETFDENKKSLILIVENTNENMNAINSLKANVDNMLKNVDKKWFYDYFLILFDSIDNITTNHFTDLSNFINKIKSITSTDDTKSCQLPIFNAINAGLKEIVYEQSIIYIITRGMPSDFDIEYAFGVNLINYLPQLYYHKVTDGDKCKVDIGNGIYRRMLDYAIGSGGSLFTTTGNNVGPSLQTIIPSLYHGAALVNPTIVNFQCSRGRNSYFHVDKNIEDLYIYVYGKNPLLSVYSSNGEKMNLELAFKDSNTNSQNLYIYRVNALTEFGIYNITIRSQGLCNAQVRGTKTSEVYFGFVPTVPQVPDIGKHLDNSTTVPTNDYNQVVATITGDFGGLTYLEIYNFGTFETQYLKFYERRNCSLEYYSDPFKCENGKLFFKFYGIDTAGSMIVRESMTICTKYWKPVKPDNSTTTTLPPYFTTTQQGGKTTTLKTTTAEAFKTKADIYLLLDTSLNVPANLYANFFTENLRAFFNNFIIDQNYVNVAFAPVPGDDNLLLLYPSFNTFTNVNTLMSTINSSFFPFDDSQSSGQQNLAYLTEMAISSSFLNTGYSSSSKPHILLYVTTKSSPDNNAIMAAYHVKNGGKFKIISIVYQPGDNLNALNTFSNCVYTAVEPAEFLEVLQGFAQHISIYSRSGSEFYPC